MFQTNASDRLKGQILQQALTPGKQILRDDLW